MNQSEKEKIVDIMKKNFFGAHLATCDGTHPRVRPVAPIVEDDLSIWVATHCSSKKVPQIRNNPKIALSFLEPGGAKVALVTGEAEIVEDLEAKKRVWKIAPLDLSRFFPDGQESPDYCLLKVTVKRIEWRDSWTREISIFKPS